MKKNLKCGEKGSRNHELRKKLNRVERSRYVYRVKGRKEVRNRVYSEIASPEGTSRICFIVVVGDFRRGTLKVKDESGEIR